MVRPPPHFQQSCACADVFCGSQECSSSSGRCGGDARLSAGTGVERRSGAGGAESSRCNGEASDYTERKRVVRDLSVRALTSVLDRTESRSLQALSDARPCPAGFTFDAGDVKTLRAFLSQGSMYFWAAGL